MKQSSRIQLFNNFVDSVQPLLTEENLNQLSATYCVRQFKLKQIDASFAKQLYLNVAAKQRKNNKDLVDLGWIQNELRLFVWTLTIYALSEKKEIDQLTEQQCSLDWQMFANIFPNKKQALFIYQGKNLLKKHNQYKKWVFEEDKLFQSLVIKDNYRLKWSQLGKNLFINSNQKYFRTPKQCRERWLNHLDPSKVKKYWSQNEDFMLIQFVYFYGKKWALISRKLNCKRNQHSIKNRFKTLLTRQYKQSRKTLTEKQMIDRIYCRLHSNQSDKIFQLSISQHYNQSEEQNQIFQIQQSNLQKTPLKDDQSVQGIVLNVLTTATNHLKLTQFAEIQQTKVKEKSSLQNSLECKQILESQIQKQIRADILLQSDPFEMLKSYFYKKDR